MQRIVAIALNTFREAVRDRILYGVLGCATLVLLFTLALAELALDQQARIVMDLGLASISLFSVVVAVFLGSSLLYKEIEKKTLYVILPKPIERWEFLVGKFAGIVLTGFVFIAIMGSVQLWVASIQAHADGIAVAALPVGLALALGVVWWRTRDVATGMMLTWCLVAVAGASTLANSVDVDLTVVLASLVLSLAEVVVLAAVAIFFSSFSTPFLTGLFTVGVWLVGRSADEMATMQSDIIPDEVKTLLHWLPEIIPNFNLFVPGRHTLSSPDAGGAWPYVADALLHASASTALLLIAAALVFRRRDFI